MVMFGLGKYLIPGLGILAMCLAVALGVSVKMNAAKAERITTLEIAVQQAAQTLAQREKQILALTTTESAQATQTATQCAAQGDSSYLRGVAVGRVIGARQCAA